jgi:hypothetical protein
MNKIEKEELIKKELTKLNKIYKNIEKDRKTIVDNLIQNCAFMTATLQELQENINNNGVEEVFINGRQEMMRESPSAKIYNQMIKNYQSAIKQLMELLPSGDPKQNEDELLSFVKKQRVENR